MLKFLAKCEVSKSHCIDCSGHQSQFSWSSVMMMMMKSSILVVFCVLFVATATGTIKNRVSVSRGIGSWIKGVSFSSVAVPFRSYGIAPDIIDVAPRKLLQISYPTFTPNLGNVASPSQVSEPPQVQYDCKRDHYYTLVMFNCDPLGESPLLRQARHWGVFNSPGCDFDRGETFVDYLPPAPLKGTGSHRYVFLLFEHEKKIRNEEGFIRSTWVWF